MIENDFAEVLGALQEYRTQTHQKNIMVSGWDLDDEELRPPSTLIRSIEAVSPRYTEYCYASSCYRAKEVAAQVLGPYIHFAGAAPSRDNVCVLPSGSDGLYLALTTLRDLGVSVLYVCAPAFFATVQIGRTLGLRVEVIPTKDFFTCSLDYERIADSLRAPHSALVLTNPAYCMGREYKEEDLARLMSVIPETAYVLLDEVLLGLNWSRDTPSYVHNFPKRAILLRSPSKTFFMYGLKMALLVGPTDVIRYVEVLSDFLSSGLPGNFESIALVYLDAWQRWEREAAYGICGSYRNWWKLTTDRLKLNLSRLQAVTQPIGFYTSLVDSGPYATVAAHREVLPHFDTVSVAQSTGILLMEPRYYFHLSNDYQGFKLNLCGNMNELGQALADVLPDYIRQV